MNEIERLQHLAGLMPRPTVFNQEPVEEDTVTKTVVGEPDDERTAIQKEMYKIGKYAIEIHKMVSTLPENADFPSWWMSKLSKASVCISEAKHYLENELNAPTGSDKDQE